ncbi:mechanosensitive ion channel protein MscS [Sulfodiicoccus acidiphilus]|uniref:Mechanosensitive ion channel protein MscS n=1 Tax=Sulfodiicoccus acidiphilus TaxID=1670455 RepID=A0A348B2H8_9CREN|nr:mechanosensitive ion channel family protein [Sulfodiicoccus acidiphilus]BBD72380.1 mechanosensitive ion channel protein MscS [Sulfodiicoccus acidiphilus]GGT97513.1 mechanosensitive ion channel protein MscS [Sulfodiicoccus acidiphilus]
MSVRKLSEREVLALVLTAIAGTLVVGAAVYFLAKLGVLPDVYSEYYYAAIWVAGVIVITYLLSTFIQRKASSVLGAPNASTLSFVVRLVGYVLAIAGFFVLLKIGLGAALAAGGFAGLVLGLASQDVLSNVFGGIMILVSRPYKIGDRVTISTWQYGLLAPTYPPKFWSADFLIPGYTGVIVDISLLYTTFVTDENVPIKIPNSIMVQAAIFVHSSQELRKVRTKYEVSKDLDPDIVIPRVKEAVKELDFVVEEPSIKILDTSQTTYVLAVDTMCQTNYEEPVRSEVIKVLMRTVKQIQKETTSH